MAVFALNTDGLTSLEAEWGSAQACPWHTEDLTVSWSHRVCESLKKPTIAAAAAALYVG